MQAVWPPGLADRVGAIRRFNRFYTRRLGALREGLLRSRFTLTEARLLYELAHRDAVMATELARDLGLDLGYLSRILSRFEREHLIARTSSAVDRRRVMLSLTADGVVAFAALDAGAREDVAELLGAMPEPAQAELVASMSRMEALLGDDRTRPYVLRPPRAGDIGWVVGCHGAIYGAEYGFDARFEALVARVAGEALAGHDPGRERCWIAERDGVNLGSVFLVRVSDDVARLRLLIVEPAARGQGIGQRLVEECLDYARTSGYQRVTLWTNDVLTAARRLYQQAGFRLVRSQPHRDFGPPLVGEDWELELKAGRQK
ncbi:MAG: bifunctional helix-turn-helix transcriptional regulator/GNAT family N-acetyltransferase [Pseudomonadota bacterium]|nr:bifunctional helix-turn-helix transcriptional regulator/GNAT family N-acetyltransferase [Pseudomonadota bacterium]